MLEELFLRLKQIGGFLRKGELFSGNLKSDNNLNFTIVDYNP